MKVVFKDPQFSFLLLRAISHQRIFDWLDKTL
jgi:hypothetical protein